jgi:hypothetical protein
MRRTTVSIREKIAVLAPMPRARVRIAMAGEGGRVAEGAQGVTDVLEQRF